MLRTIPFRILQIVAVLGVWFTVTADSSTNFGIYLTFKPIDVTSSDLSGIALEDKPMVTGSDIEYYHPTNGVVVVKEEAMRRIRAL